MTKIIGLLFFILLFSCTNVNKEKKELTYEAWKGRPVAELKKHPYFQSLSVSKIKHDDGLETWVFRDQARFQTSAYCQSLGGCMGLPNYNCDSAFSVKDEVILGLEQNGSCPPAKTFSPDRSTK